MTQGPPLVLQVDDEDDAFAIADTCAQRGVPVSLNRAVNGKDVIEYLHGAFTRGGADFLQKLILLAINLPTMTGHHFISGRSGQAFKRMPGLNLSSSDAGTAIALARQTALIHPWSRRCAGPRGSLLHDRAVF